MSLHISDDDRAGFAILDFQRDIGTEDLTITLKSKLLHPGEYFGAGGKWTPAPHFFKAVRVPDRGPGVYRIGPEIVNQSGLTLDAIEVSVHGSAIAEAVTWPLLLLGRDAVPLHEPTTVPPAPALAGELPEKPAALPDAQSKDSFKHKDAAGPSDEETPVKPGAPSGGRKPSRAPKPSAPQDPHFWQKRTGASTVLALLPEQPRNRGLGAVYGLTALSVFVIAALISTVWLFCIPFLGVQCKAGAGIDAINPCVAGQGNPQACAKEAALAHPGQARGREKADAAGKPQPMAQSGMEQREAIEAKAAEQAMAEEAARGKARLDAEERRKAEEAAQLTAQREAAERQAAKAAAAERAVAGEAARGKARLDAEERRKAEETARLAALPGAEEPPAAKAAAQAREAALQPAPMMASLNPVQENGAPSVPDGDYSGRTSRDESCSPIAESLIVTIKDGRVCWEHDLKSSNRWAGTIDRTGVIEARAQSRPGTSATGHIVNGGAMSVEMRYPDCANPIGLKLLGMIGTASACP
jgi:hypothetical protein